MTWGRADFDGDWDVDITDFELLASHFAPDGYPLPSFEQSADAVPEPIAMILFAVGMAGAALLRTT